MRGIRLTPTGLTLCKEDGSDLSVFVPYVLPDEIFDARITQTQKNFAKAVVTKLIKPSALRQKPHCKHFGVCGGCDLQHLKDEEQLNFKKEILLTQLQKMGGFDLTNLPEIILRPTHEKYYRRRVQVPVVKNNDQIELGFFRAESHQVEPLQECFIQNKSLTEIILILAKKLNEFQKQKPGFNLIYDEKKHQGELRHIILKTNRAGDEVLLGFVTQTSQNGWMKVFWEEIKELLKPYNVIGFLQNVQSKRGNTILSEHWNLIQGTAEFKESDFDLNLYDTLASFTQVNLEGEKIIHATLKEWLEGLKSKHLLDVYGGRGDFSFLLRESFKNKIIVEENHISVALGQKVVKENGLKDFEYICDKAEKVIKEKAQVIGDFVAIVDPPRKGLMSEVITALNDNPAVKLAYVSCDPVTLARDLKLLCEKTYEIEHILLIDMFPQTHHMETMVLLKGKN